MTSIHHRKLYPSESKCNYVGCTNSPPLPPPLPSPPPPRPPLNRNYGSKQSHHFSPILIPMFCVLGSVFIALCYLIFIKRYNSNSNNSQRRNPLPFDDDDGEDDLVHENHGPVLDHPIWYINTVGLQQSIIDSIAVFKYKRNDEEQGLIEGTDCSVCLNEFQEDETLRLLPKCSHAFHLPCIDTWLRSHKNCPLCRAPIVCDSNSNDARSSPPEPNSNRLGPREEAWQENYDRLGSRPVGGGSGTIEPRDGADISEVLRENLRCSDGKIRELRVLSDLADRRLKVDGNWLQPVRRSISLDGSSASRIYFPVSNISGMEFEGCSSTQQLVRVKKVNSEKFAEKLNRNLSFSVLMKSSSMGRSLQNRPVSMKRSFSSSRKLSRRFSRSQDSIAPFACR